MSYTRSGESGYYIYPTDETVEFVVSQASVSNEEIDIFLYKLFSKRKSEFFKRIKHGKKLIKDYEKNEAMLTINSIKNYEEKSLSEYDLNRYKKMYKYMETSSDREMLHIFIENEERRYQDDKNIRRKRNE